MNMQKLIPLAILIFFTINISGQSIPADTTETAGRGGRIAGVALCALGVCYAGIFAPLAYLEDTRSNSDIRFLSMGDKGISWAIGGTVCIGVSISFLVKGYKKRNEYLHWKSIKELQN
jgi:hypothetical protein